MQPRLSYPRESRWHSTWPRGLFGFGLVFGRLRARVTDHEAGRCGAHPGRTDHETNPRRWPATIPRGRAVNLARVRPVPKPLICGFLPCVPKRRRDVAAARSTRVLLLVLGLVLADATVARAETPEQIYNSIKLQEGRIPAPEPADTGTVGAFDVRTGEFTGPRTQVTHTTGPDGKPHRTEIHPTLEIDGVNARLRFRFRHVVFRKSVTLRVRGLRRHKRVPRPANSRSVIVDIGRSRSASWSITTRAGAQISDEVQIHRPRILGAGVFILEAVPVAVIYVPPQPADSTKTNSATYVQSSEIGTRITTRFSQEDSTTQPTVPFGFKDDADLQADIAALGTVLSAVPEENVKIAGAALTAISGAMGKAAGTQEEIKSSVREGALELTLTDTDECESATRAGPGVGDGIAFLQTVRLVWLDDGARTRLALLGADDFGCKSIRSLRDALKRLQGPAAPEALCLASPHRGAPLTAQSAQRFRRCRQGLSRATIQSLIDQDPFAGGGPQAELSADRFERRTGIISDADFVRIKTLRFTVQQQDSSARSRATVTAEDYSKGFLSFLGVGPSETKRVTSTVTATSGSSLLTGRTVVSRVRIEGPPPGTERIKVYYDRVYGTFALQAG